MPQPQRAPSLPLRSSPSSSRIVSALVAVAAANWLGYLLIVGQPLQAHFLLQVTLACLAMVSAGWVFVHQHRYWTLPMQQLIQAVRQVRSGELPIDELSQIRGGVAPLVMLTQELLRELRRQRANHAELECEMSQRVANRTEALERKLGTLKQQASRDPLTGLHNRRLLDEHLPQLVEKCVMERSPLAVLMIDVDYFKQVNDTLGHAAGDQLLTNVGQLIRSSIREQDLAFRYGGDEFAVVLPGETRAHAQTLADRLVSLMDQLARTLKVTLSPRLSIGIATLSDATAPTAEGLLGTADHRLYEIKQSRHPRRTPTAA